LRISHSSSDRHPMGLNTHGLDSSQTERLAAGGL